MVKEEDILSDFLKMKNLYFEFIKFEATGKEAQQDGSAEVEFKTEHSVDEKIITVKLFCNVKVKDIFVTEILLVGLFETDNINSNSILPNAIAIMFPYLRAQVSLITAQPNIPTISLKPVNINALLAKQNSN